MPSARTWFVVSSPSLNKQSKKISSTRSDTSISAKTSSARSGGNVDTLTSSSITAPPLLVVYWQGCRASCLYLHPSLSDVGRLALALPRTNCRSDLSSTDVLQLLQLLQWTDQSRR